MRTHNEAEWKAFSKNARRFDSNPPEKRYGVLNPSANPPYKEEDMLYSDCPLKLHCQHWDNWPTHALRKHLDTIEVMDGKKPRGYSSFVKTKKYGSR